MFNSFVPFIFQGAAKNTNCWITINWMQMDSKGTIALFCFIIFLFIWCLIEWWREWKRMTWREFRKYLIKGEYFIDIYKSGVKQWKARFSPKAEYEIMKASLAGGAKAVINPTILAGGSVGLVAGIDERSERQRLIYETKEKIKNQKKENKKKLNKDEKKAKLFNFLFWTSLFNKTPKKEVLQKDKSEELNTNTSSQSKVKEEGKFMKFKSKSPSLKELSVKEETFKKDQEKSALEEEQRLQEKKEREDEKSAERAKNKKFKEFLFSKLKVFSRKSNKNKKDKNQKTNKSNKESIPQATSTPVEVGVEN